MTVITRISGIGIRNCRANTSGLTKAKVGGLCPKCSFADNKLQARRHTFRITRTPFVCVYWERKAG